MMRPIAAVGLAAVLAVAAGSGPAPPAHAQTPETLVVAQGVDMQTGDPHRTTHTHAVNVLAGITGSASGGLSIALEAMGRHYLEAARAQGVGPELLHRVAAMASGGMDTLPHNGAVITLLAIAGLTHRQAYADIFAITLIKTAAVFALAVAASYGGWAG